MSSTLSFYHIIISTFLQYEKAIKRDGEDEGSDELAKLQATTRDKLLGGVGKLSDQDGQLNGVVKTGYEAQAMIRDGAKNLRDQRDYIENAGRNNMKAQNEISRADKIVKTMRVREFCYRIILYVLVVILLGAWLCVLIVKLS